MQRVYEQRLSLSGHYAVHLQNTILNNSSANSVDLEQSATFVHLFCTQWVLG